MLRAVGTVLGDEGYQVAFVVSALGTLLAWWSLRHGSVHVGFAVVAVVAALVGLRFEYDIDARFVIGLAMLGLAALIDPSAMLLRIVALLVGASLVVGQLAGIAGWMQIVGFVSIVAAAPARGAVSTESRRGACPSSCWSASWGSTCAHRTPK